MLKKIAVIGEKESVLGFKAVGFDTFEARSNEETRALIHRLAGEEYGILFITEHVLAPIIDVLDDYKDSQLPAIIPIPGTKGSLGLGMSNVRKSVERAVGADILFKD